MDELRWILLGIGVLIIAGIYLWGVRGAIFERLGLQRSDPEDDLRDNDALGEPAAEEPVDRREPAMGDLPQDVGAQEFDLRSPGEQESAAMEVGSLDPSLEEDSERLNIVLTLMAPDGQELSGSAIAAVAEDLGLRQGRQGTLDCYTDSQGRGTPVFSFANVLEPGVFDWSELATLKTPGLISFMRLPGSAECQESLELMLSVNQQLSKRLGGVLCDDRRVRLTQQGIEHLRVQVGEFERRRRLEILRRGQI